MTLISTLQLARDAFGVRTVAASLALFCMLMVNDGAKAQLAPGYSGTSSAPVEGTESDYWHLLRVMGECAAQLKYDEAVAFLATDPGSSAEAKAFHEIFGGQRNVCMRNFVSATLVRAHLRGAVAEGLYKRLAREARSPSPAAATSTIGMEQDIRTLHDFARCYVRSHEAEARTLLMETRLATREERATVVRMAPDFAECFPAGREIEINPIEIRLAIAEAMYKSLAGGRQS